MSEENLNMVWALGEALLSKMAKDDLVAVDAVNRFTYIGYTVNRQGNRISLRDFIVESTGRVCSHLPNFRESAVSLYESNVNQQWNYAESIELISAVAICPLIPAKKSLDKAVEE